MPLAIIRRKAGNPILADLAKSLAKELPDIIAPHLTVEGADAENGLVTPDDIEVWSNEGSPDDANTKDIEIIIYAHNYAERLANLDDRNTAITAGVRKFISEQDNSFPGILFSGFVWVLLAPTAFERL